MVAGKGDGGRNFSAQEEMRGVVAAVPGTASRIRSLSLSRSRVTTGGKARALLTVLLRQTSIPSGVPYGQRGGGKGGWCIPLLLLLMAKALRRCIILLLLLLMATALRRCIILLLLLLVAIALWRCKSILLLLLAVYPTAIAAAAADGYCSSYRCTLVLLLMAAVL